MDLGWLRTVVNKNFGTDNLDAIFDNFAPNLSAMISNIFSNTNKMQGSLEYQSELMGDVKRELQDIRIHSSEAYWKGRFEESERKNIELKEKIKQLEEERNRMIATCENMSKHLDNIDEERNKEFHRLFDCCYKLGSSYSAINKDIREIKGKI